ncbi:histone deacetylase 14 [Tanacetum coccineum]
MRILSVVRIKAYSRYMYEYLKEITLRRADHQEYTIAKKDFKNLYPSDFEDLNLLLLQGHLNHLPGSDIRMLSTAVKMWIRNLVIRQRVEDFQLGIESYQKQLNLTKPGWDATGFEFKHDYTIIDSPCAVVFPVSNNEQKIMRFNEIYKFSDGTLTNIMETLDYKVKEYKETDIQEKEQKESQKQTNPSTGWKGQSRSEGAEIARTKCKKYGKTSSNVFNQKIDYAPTEVSTRYGISGVKVWISYSQKEKGRDISETSPDLPITGKPTEVRIGKGKGNPAGWIARVSTGQIPFEMDGVSLSNARQAATLAAHKLCASTKFVQWS